MPSALIGRPGEDVEAVVAILLCRRHEHAARQRAGRGDRGVDIVVPVPNGRIDVYQVKRYHGSLNPSQWRRIQDSYTTLVNAVADGHFAVRNWYLVMPLDQSEGDAAKFGRLIEGGPFERCEWKGLAWLDALASQYPEVVDYYLGNGKARLEEAHRDLMRILDARASASERADTASTEAGLTALHRTLNRHDPMYRYDFAVGAAEDRDMYVPHDPPGTLVFTAQVVHDGVCVTWHVHARCDESVRERPIPIGLRFQADGDPALRESLRLFADYGQPFSAADGTTTISMDLPGGFGDTTEYGSVAISPTAEDRARRYILRLRVVGSDGVATEPVRLTMNAPTVGARGARLSGEHDGGTFTFEGLHDFEPPTMHVQFSGLDLTGKPVASVIGGAEFLHSLRSGRLEVAAEHGPFRTFGDVPSRERSDARQDDEGDSGVEDILEALRALAAIQEHTSTALLVPDFNEVTRGDVREWRNVARILAGETVVDPRLGELTATLTEPSAETPESQCAFAVVGELFAQVGEQRVTLGEQTLHISAARVHIDPDHPERLTVTPPPGLSWSRAQTSAS